MSNEKFTVKQGLAVQAKDLAFWQKLLKKRHFAKLQEIVAYANTYNEHRDGYDVYRGSDITCAVQNLGRKSKSDAKVTNYYETESSEFSAC